MQYDGVSRLERYCARNGLCVTYTSESSGKQHDPIHSVTATVSSMPVGTPNGTEITATKSAPKKKEARQLAAQAVWLLLQDSILLSSAGPAEDDDVLTADSENYVGQLQVCYIIYKNDLCDVVCTQHQVCVLFCHSQNLCQLRKWDLPVYKLEINDDKKTVTFGCACTITHVNGNNPYRDSIRTWVNGKSCVKRQHTCVCVTLARKHYA